jgi:hypothetical protein
MRTYVLAIVSAALFALPTAAFSQAAEFLPAGVRIYPYERPYDRPYRRNYQYGGECRELRQACLHKEEPITPSRAGGLKGNRHRRL